MRVYGSSPLYRYLELLFRSRRLFLASILIATAATTFLFFWQPRKYEAKGIYLLSGNQAAQLDANAGSRESERDSIRYKINILNIELQNPDFFQKALTAQGLNRDRNGNLLSRGDFAKLCADVRKAMSYTAGENVLEIKCVWPTRQAEDFVTAVYKYYSEKVLDAVTTATTSQVESLTALEKIYAARRARIDKQIRDYQLSHVLVPDADPAAANNQYYTQQQDVTRLENELKSSRGQLALLQAKLKTTEKTRTDQVISGRPGQDAVFASAQEELDKAQKAFDAAKIKYTPANPEYKATEKKVADAKAKLAQLNVPGSSSSTPTTELRRVEISNPAYDALTTEVNEKELEINKAQMTLADAQKVLHDSEQRARVAPGQLYAYKQLTRDQQLYVSIHENVNAKLQQANIDADADRQTERNKMQERVAPLAELEPGTKRYLVLAAGPLLGLVVAFTFSLLGESLDHSIRTPAEVEKYLGKPVLAILPAMKMKGKGAANRQLGGDTRPTLPSA